MAGVAGPLHPRSRDALEEVRREAGKAIVLLNRRGWSNFLSCRRCGRVWQCPNCDVVARARTGRPAAWPATTAATPRRCRETCPDCRSVSVARHGIGTERLEAELEALMAPLPVFRLDADAPPGRRSGAAAALRAARRGRARGHADGGEGPRLPRGHARARDRRRLRAALPRLPRRGAHVRARGAARGPQRPGRARRTRDRAGARPRRPRAPPRRATTTPRASSPGELAAASCSATRPSPSSSAWCAPRRSRAPSCSPPSGCAPGVQAAVGDQAQVLGPAPLFRSRTASARRWW